MSIICLVILTGVVGQAGPSAPLPRETPCPSVGKSSPAQPPGPKRVPTLGRHANHRRLTFGLSLPDDDLFDDDLFDDDLFDEEEAEESRVVRPVLPDLDPEAWVARNRHGSGADPGRFPSPAPTSRPSLHLRC